MCQDIFSNDFVNRQVTVPLVLSVNAVVTFKKFSRDPVPQSFFDVPPEYVPARDMAAAGKDLL